jgi:tetratricopeptide (TPR) repeat protein
MLPCAHGLDRDERATGVKLRRLVLLLGLAVLASSCAYYNTLYLARKYYFKGTLGLPYLVDKRDAALAQNFTKAIDFSKKVLANYPKSKWVDDAYLLWARSLLGRDDPRETVNMLQDFPVRFPNSDLKVEALFYLGVGYRQSRRNSEAEATLARYLEQVPKSDLSPYAWLERARALSAIDHDSAAAYCAGQVLERFPRSALGPQALAARAQALLDAGEFVRARADYRTLGLKAMDDDERLTFLFREADCLEASRDYEVEMGLLKEALSHEQLPVVTEGATGPVAYQPTPGGDRYGRIQIRIGTVHLMAERRQAALDAYQEVVRLYPKSPLSAEAQYRTGYAYEISGDDFERARGEYSRVKDEFPNSAFSTQAESRMTNFDRLKQFRSAGGDTLQKRAEAGFLLAELYLFQLSKPERALDEYGKVATDFAGTSWAAKALTAEAWVLSRKLARQVEADSLLWLVVRDYPATESQLAARDYLEQEGITVPDSLIRLPLAPVAPPTDTTSLTPPPAGPTPLGRLAAADSTGVGARSGGVLGRPVPRRGFMRRVTEPRTPWDPRYAGTSSGAPSLVGDSPFTGSTDEVDAGADSARATGMRAPAPPVAPPGLPPAPPAIAPPDTAHAAVADSLRGRTKR